MEYITMQTLVKATGRPGYVVRWWIMQNRVDHEGVAGRSKVYSQAVLDRAVKELRRDCAS
jgi:hypothetical protein